MKIAHLVVHCGIALLLGLAACQNRAFQTLIIYDSPSRFVRLQMDPTVGTNRGHSHPARVTTDEMAAILSGLMIEEPAHLISFLVKEQELPRHPAFNATEIGFLAPLLAKGLGLATSEEVVTFYQTRQETAIVRKVTSGGLFIDGEELHIVLSNYRSPTHYASDPGVGDTFDDRLTPMRSIAPQEAKLDFEPISAVAPSRESRLTSLLTAARREVVVLFRQLAPAKAGAGRESDRELARPRQTSPGEQPPTAH
ncbi:MAG: hypothetical protein SGJ16_02510 [Nitrospirota bacterium]|nr:hypothetical protein [Nitrospirota bacterium]